MHLAQTVAHFKGKIGNAKNQGIGDKFQDPLFGNFQSIDLFIYNQRIKFKLKDSFTSGVKNVILTLNLNILLVSFHLARSSLIVFSHCALEPI